MANIRLLIYNPPGLRVPIRQTFRTDTVSALCIPAQDNPTADSDIEPVDDEDIISMRGKES